MRSFLIASICSLTALVAVPAAACPDDAQSAAYVKQEPARSVARSTAASTTPVAAATVDRATAQKSRDEPSKKTLLAKTTTAPR